MSQPDSPPADDEQLPAKDSRPATEPATAAGKASRRASGGSSPGSSAAADFFAEPGSFDPDQADDDAAEADAAAGAAIGGELLEPVLWTPERIKRILRLQGTVTHGLVGVAEQDWLWLDAELDLVAGPLAEYCNRVPALAALAHYSDDAAIAAGFGSYLLRSYRERVRELKRRAALAAEPQPVTGRRAEPAAAQPTTMEDPEWTVGPGRPTPTPRWPAPTRCGR